MMPKRPLRIRPAIEVMSDISDATVLGAVDKTAGAAGLFDAAFDFLAFAAVRLRAAAEVVVFFFVLVCAGRGTAAIEARRITENIRNFRYSIDFDWTFRVLREDLILPGKCEFHTITFAMGTGYRPAVCS